MKRLVTLLEKKYNRKRLSLQELEELRTLLFKEHSDTHETIAMRKFTFR